MSANLPQFNFAGRVALITGAARGIGLAIVETLAANGCAVAIQDLDIAAAKARTQSILRSGVNAIALGGDISDAKLPERLVRETLKRLGGLHILINNASIQGRVHWTNLTLAAVEKTFRANLAAPLRLCQEAHPIFQRQQWGRIVNIGSIQQKFGNEAMLDYAMSKAALQNMTMALARDMAADGVTVNLIAPGYINTLRNREKLGDPKGRRNAAKKIPAQRVGDPQDCAGVALLLCSDAGSYITGQTIYVDGGLSVQQSTNALTKKR
jgi:NAD(P)-dependent dehydrogenase (short-subunit alcohol dehydrogenase family)